MLNASLINQSFLRCFTNSYKTLRRNYYLNSILPENINILLGDTNCISAKTAIQFEGLAWSTSKKNAIQALGSPQFSVENQEGEYVHTVLFYKEKSQYIPVLTQLHFINNKLFYVCNSIESDIALVKGAMLRKYCPLTIDTNFNPVVLVDDNNNKLIINDSFPLQLGYFTGDQEMLEMVKKIQAYKTADAEATIHTSKELAYA